MRALAVLTCTLGALLSGCGGCGSDAETRDAGIAGDAAPPFNACDGDPGAFVRQAFLALDGRRPMSQAEVDVYTDLYAAVVAKGGDPKDAVARAIMAEPGFDERWIQMTMDAMHVQRYDIQTEASCWDHGDRASATPALATAVRDQLATGAGDAGAWTMSDLASSAILLDDVTPVYRAQLFSMMDHPIPAANVGQVEAELARRADFGATFDAGYLHRDTVCLDCHNSSTSVTDTDDPATDRFWPVPGLPEKPVYGAFRMINSAVAHTAFRVDSFVEVGSSHPWNWDGSCGSFNAGTVPPDPAGISGQLASVIGTQTTVYNLEAALKRGFDKLRGQLPPIDAGTGAITDPDTALAWLVTLKMTEDVWIQVAGSQLTIANYYPRNKASSDLLYALASRYTQSGYSLKALLAAIVSSDYFNRQPAEDACGAGPYTYPNVYDPWVIADPDPAKHLNGPGDVVAAVDGRTLVTALAKALDWKAPPVVSRFADYGDSGCDTEPTCQALQSDCQGFNACCEAASACQMKGPIPAIEVPFERGVGMFLRNSERGFRGLDFQARLVWENHEALCAKPAWVTSDFITTLIAGASADSTATVADLVAALKDRLIGEPTIDPGAETTALNAMIGDLGAVGTTATEPQLRAVCGALVNTPQFLLAGIAGRGGALPKLTPLTEQYAMVCADVAAHVPGATCIGKLALP